MAMVDQQLSIDQAVIDKTNPTTTNTAHGKETNAISTIESNLSVETPFTIYSHREKIFLAVLVSSATFLSPVTANIYFPAIPDLARDLHSTVSLINLTITSYLIFQGLAPTFVGAISDQLGRRPAYIACFIIYLTANIGLSVQNSYAALLILRCVQSSGSSGTVALSSAVVADFATSAERGTYVGYAAVGALLGPTLGPIIGGLLNQYLGWRAIFWFLVMFSAVVLIIFLIILPETCRKVVGNGSIPAQRWNISLLAYLKLRKQRKRGEEPTASAIRLTKFPNPFGSIFILFSKEGGCILLYSGLMFGGFYTVLASLPSNFGKAYGFNSLQIGLCYLPMGAGGMFAAVAAGRTTDWNFRRHARRLDMKITQGRQFDITNFPIEIVRLQIIVPMVAIATVSIIAYGWIVDANKSLAGPLVFLFLLGASIMGSFSVMNALMVDLYPSSPGTASAAGNLVRCWLGAGAVAAIHPLTNIIGIGWTGTFVGGLFILFSPLLWMVWNWGPAWREEKRLRDLRIKTKALVAISTADAEVGNVK